MKCSAPVDGDYPLQSVSCSEIFPNSKLHFDAGIPGARRSIDIHLCADIHAGRLVAGIIGPHARQLD